MIFHSNKISTTKLFNSGSIFFFYGEDDYLKERIIKSIINHLKKEKDSSVDINILYGEETTKEETIQELETLPFLSKKKILLIKHFDKILNFKKVVEFLVQFKSDRIITILTASKLDLRKKGFSILQKIAVNISCKNPYSVKDILPRIKDKIKQYNIQIKEEDLLFFANHVNLDYASVDMELEKLHLFTMENKDVTRADVMATIEKSRNYNIFQLQNSIGMKRLKESLYILNELQTDPSSDYSIIPILNNFFSIILKIDSLLNFYSEFEISKNHLNEVFYIFRKDYFKYAKLFPRERVLEIFEELLEAEIMLKSSYIKPKVIFTRLIYKMCS